MLTRRLVARLLFPSLATAVLLLIASSVQVSAQVPRLLSYQGFGYDIEGLPLANGTHSLTISLYTVESGGAPIFTQTMQTTTVDGLFSVLIGPLPENVRFERQYWFGIAFDGGSELLPRTQMTTSPYAFNAQRADTAGIALGVAPNAPNIVRSVNGMSGQVTLQGSGGTNVTANGGVITIASENTGGGTENVWALNGNREQDEAFIGTLNGKAFEIHVSEDSLSDWPAGGFGRVMRYQFGGTSPDVIGGHFANSVTAMKSGATIGGGGTFATPNTVDGDFGTIAGGYGNTISADESTIGGGAQNAASSQAATVSGGLFNKATGNSATIGGGQRNEAEGWNSTVGGGRENIAESLSSTVAGGDGNQATGTGATIVGGIGNKVFGDYGFVGGGESNGTSMEYSVVAGGRNNSAYSEGGAVLGGQSNSAPGKYSSLVGGLGNISGSLYSFIGGGEANKSQGQSSVVGGGSQNVATGDYSTIPGGRALTLTGDYAFGFLGSTDPTPRPMTVSAPNVAVLGNVDLWIANNDDDARALRFYPPYSTTGTFPGLNTPYSSFEASADQSVAVRYILPADAGSVGDNLSIASTNGLDVTLSWEGQVSDRNRKENLLAIESEEVLQRFRDLQLGTWNYRGESRRHYGVMAQDFHAAFGQDRLGTIGTDSTVHVGDMAGVAYIAIQALEKRTEELRRTQSELRESINALKRSEADREELIRRIERLEALLPEGSR